MFFSVRHQRTNQNHLEQSRIFDFETFFFENTFFIPERPARGFDAKVYGSITRKSNGSGVKTAYDELLEHEEVLNAL